jgi:hypothetical protein
MYHTHHANSHARLRAHTHTRSALQWHALILAKLALASSFNLPHLNILGPSMKQGFNAISIDLVNEVVG